MFFHKSLADTPNLEKKGTNIVWTNAINYLGVYIGKKLNFVKDMNYSIGKATTAKDEAISIVKL